MSLDTPSTTAATEPLWPGFSSRSHPIGDPPARDAEPVRAQPLATVRPGESEFVALNHVHTSVAGSSDPGVAVRTALSASMSATHASVGSLWIYRGDGRLVRAAHAGLGERYLEQFTERPDWEQEQKVLIGRGEIIAQAGGVSSRDLPGLVPPPGIESLLVVPLRTRGMRVGGLLLGHEDPGWATKHSREFLLMLGDVLGAALDTARLMSDLRAGQELHAGLLQAALDAIVVVDPRGAISEVNAAFERLLGRRREELLGRSLFDLQEPASGAVARGRFVELMRTGTPLLGEPRRFRHADGTSIPVVINATLLTDSSGEVLGAVDVVHDERERQRSEQLVREAHARLAQVLAHLDVGVALLRLPGLTVVEHNPALARLLEAEAISGAQLRALLPDGAGGDFEHLHERALASDAGQASADLELRFGTRPARCWNVALSLLPRPVESSPSLAVLTVADITSRRDLEERLRHAQKMEAVGTLAGGIAHEFNNLLTAILGNVTLALLDLPNDHPLAAGLRDCEAAAQRAADLTRQMLGFGRRTALRTRPADLRETVSDSLPLVRRMLDPRIKIEREDDRDLWRAFVDPAHIGQALMNICMNARDAMPDGGSLRVRTYNAPAGTVPGREGDHVVLEISDTGQGIPPEVLERMWEPFFTTRGPSHGLGLGLSVVHGIVEQHGGHVVCESVPGQGTTFRIYLPRHVEAPVPPTPAPGKGEVVLVVDDEESVRALARSVLERLGYRVIQAADGVRALDLVREMGAAIQLVILDQTMPRMSGSETLRQMRKLAPGLPVLLTSGYEPGGGPQGGADPQADGFLPKPYAPEAMGRVVRNLLESRGKSTDTRRVGRTDRGSSA